MTQTPVSPEGPEQETLRGETIPVPTRRRVLDDLRKVAKAPRSPSDADGGGAEDQE